MASYLTLDDERNFGSELLDVAIRAAKHGLAPELERLHGENAQLRDEVSRAATTALNQALDAAVPNWRQINNDPRFHQWLLTPEIYSGVIRDRLLKDAAAAGDAERLIRFFRGFLQEQGVAGQPTASARSRRAGPTVTGRIYSRADIERYSRAYREGRIPEAEYQRISADIVRASREGRILNPEPLNGLGAIG